MKKALVLSAALSSLSGCATVTDLPQGYTLGTRDAEGLALVSLTVSGKDLDRVSSFEYRVRETAAVPGGEVKRSPHFNSAQQLARWLQDHDAQGPAAQHIKLIVKGEALVEPLDVIESGKAVGRVAALRLPAGDYELYDWKMVVPNQYGRDELSPQRAMAYRFRIEGGRATYLGNVDLRVTERHTYNVTIENKANRDLALLTKRLPSLTSEDILVRPGELRQ